MILLTKILEQIKLQKYIKNTMLEIKLLLIKFISLKFLEFDSFENIHKEHML